MQGLIPELAALCLWVAVWLLVQSSDSLVIYLPYLTGHSLLKLRHYVALGPFWPCESLEGHTESDSLHIRVLVKA